MAGCCKLSLSDSRNGEGGRERRKETKTEWEGVKRQEMRKKTSKKIKNKRRGGASNVKICL